MLCEYFCRIQFKNDSFFTLINLDEDNRFRNVFWVDATSRTTYKYFSDIITFNTTYLTIDTMMPFAPFIGANHHGQSILLRAALVSSEDIETFTWLF